MTRSQFEQLIQEEVEKELKERKLIEKSVPQPYDRKSPPRRKMTAADIKKRKKIGKAMEKNPDTVKRFKNKFERDWKDYLWAAATNKVLGRR